jgi:hypothetical protein
VKPSAFLDDAGAFGALDGEPLEPLAPSEPADAAELDDRISPERTCQVCGKPGLRYNAKVHPGPCRRERRRRTQKDLRGRQRRR